MSDKNTEEKVMKTWGESQQKLMTDWLDTLRRLGGTPTLELWRKTVDTWQTSVKETLDAQMEWTRQWTETLAKAKGTPEELRDWAGISASKNGSSCRRTLSNPTARPSCCWTPRAPWPGRRSSSSTRASRSSRPRSRRTSWLEVALGRSSKERRAASR